MQTPRSLPFGEYNEHVVSFVESECAVQMRIDIYTDIDKDCTHSK